MDNKEYAVVFDTNTYRDFVKGKSQEEILSSVIRLKEAERNHQIVQYGILTVAREMLAHLANTHSLDYMDCMNGIIAMSNHCFDVEYDDMAIIPPPGLHLINSYFNDLITNEMIMTQKDTQNILKNFKVDSKSAFEKYSANGTFQSCKKFIDSNEEDFVNSIIETIEILENEAIKEHQKQTNNEIDIANKRKKNNSKQIKRKILEIINNNEFKLRIAINLIQHITREIKHTESVDETKNKAKSLLINFPIAIDFLVWITRIVVERDINLLNKSSRKKRWNWLWDYHVAFLISHHTVDKREVLLVTRDSEMTIILGESGFNNRVMNLEKYKELIGYKET